MGARGRKNGQEGAESSLGKAADPKSALKRPGVTLGHCLKKMA